MERKLINMGLNHTKVSEIVHLFEKKGAHMNVINFVIMLERYGVERTQITELLKDVGIDDTTIINIFTEVDMKKDRVKGLDIAQLVLEE